MALRERSQEIEKELQMLTGGAADFAKLYDRYRPILLGIALSYTGNKASADDLVQDVFEKLWLNRSSLAIEDLRAYLFGMIRNRSIDWYRKQKPDVSLEEAMNRLSDAENDAAIVEKETGKQVEELIRALSPQCRTVFLLVRFERMKYREVAELLSLSEKTVENHMGRALKALRIGMQSKGHHLNSWALFLLFTQDWMMQSNFFKEGLGV
ncbi:MAG: RNA polymerase sigma-70 factor [Bacteroidota bacterium]|nr:RNA polymerase sigma-70 factor [Bacteroidota bacterium]MDX5431403.1 RNA polymerase sigma-70 factor [Bacteroidota bacterium]MDX5470131.1 RNA polymerase sigma-70 factor [Bacteroidota bacterium]